MFFKMLLYLQKDANFHRICECGQLSRQQILITHIPFRLGLGLVKLNLYEQNKYSQQAHPEHGSPTTSNNRPIS